MMELLKTIDWTDIFNHALDIVAIAVGTYATWRWKKQDKCERKHAEEQKEIKEES